MWNLDRINEYISNGIEENLNLEYKGSGALAKSDGAKSELSKDVSAFANSAGGIIIYGISEYNDQARKHLPEKIDPVDRNTFSKEWLEQVINTNVFPKIKDLKIVPIQVGTLSDNTIIYVVEIKQSITAHQAKDRRYYKRYNFESVAMEDYEIKDIINRANKTDIRIIFRPPVPIARYQRFFEDGTRFKLKTEIWAHNRGNNVTRFLEVFISGHSDASDLIISPSILRGRDFQLRFSNEEERKININDIDFIIGVDRFPILPNVERLIGDLEFYSDLLTKDVEIEVLVSTEDGSKIQISKGSEMIKGFKELKA